MHGRTIDGRRTDRGWQASNIWPFRRTGNKKGQITMRIMMV